MRFIKFFLVLVSILYGIQGFAQNPKNLSTSDLNSVNIDELSDEQVQRFLDRAKESGLTLEQLELVAKQRGMSSTQIAKLRNRIRELQLGASEDGGQIQSASDRLRSTQDEEQDGYDFFSFLNEADTLDPKKLEIFGMDIFKSADIAFEPSLNVATPENYVLGAGDELIIDIYGASEITYQQMVTPDGGILISGIGPISLAGLTVKEARNRIFNKLSNIYSGLKGGNPNTFMQVSVGQVKSIKVNVVGQVVQPGTYTLSSFSSAFNALYFAGGPSDNGSLREIEIQRGGKRIAVLDVYSYLFLGDDTKNPQLQDQDVIVVKPYLNRVKLAGNVKQPAIYELKDNETLDFLMKFAGGFNDKAFKEFLTIDRIGETERKVVTIKSSDFGNAGIQDGDSLYISKVRDTYSNRVKIDGAINRPGYYELTDGLKLAELIGSANGVREDAYLKRGNIIRLTDKLRLTNISFDVESVLEGRQDLLLSPNDRITIPSIFDVEEEQTIAIDGQIRNPGEYPFVDNMTVEDLINLSGGLKSDASTTTIEIARRLTNDEDLSRSSEIFTITIDEDLAINPEESDFKLKPFDLVLVKSTPFVRNHKVIKVEGEVNYPGYYALESNEDKISDIIKRAGGLTEYGYPDGASLIRQTEYYRTKFEKEEIDALVMLKRKDLESRYLKNAANTSEAHRFIEEQIIEYEKQLTEALKIEQSKDELEARIFRAQQMRKLLVRDSVSGSEELIERQAIGIDLVRILNSPKSSDDMILKDGDLISVPKKLETVRVQGEVLYPNTVRFKDGVSFKKYVSSSGGFSSKAKVGKSYIVYANGTAKRTKSFLFLRKFPKVKPGADIIVPQKEFRQGVDAREIIALTSAVATMLLVIDRLSN